RHTRGAQAAPLVLILVVQSLRVLADFLELSILVVRLVLAWGKMKPPGFLLALELMLLKTSRIYTKGLLLLVEDLLLLEKVDAVGAS
nr:hypothetical protein [Tanacetum cinerariifolium]